MKKNLVYDLPTRFFHWLFVILFVFAFAVAKTVDDDSLTFSYHMLAGILLLFILAFRFVWLFLGTRYSLIKNFSLNIKDLVDYFKSIINGSKKTWAGHNPASSWAGLIMMTLATGLGITGILMAQSDMNKENFEDLHELLANGLLIVSILHIMGVILHTIRHKDIIALSMIDGKKSNLDDSEAIPSASIFSGLVFVAAVSFFALYLSKNFDTQKRELRVFGTTLQLGESEGENNHLSNTEHSESKKTNDDDDDADDDK